MPMNEYGEIVRNSSSTSTQNRTTNTSQNRSNNSGSNDEGCSGCCSCLVILIIAIAIISAIVEVVSGSTFKTDYKPDTNGTSVTESYVVEAADYYILPNSNSEYISYSDLNGLTREEVVLARNEIFARRGRMFTTDYIADYFDSQSWYNPIYSAEDFPVSILNEYERENINTILEYEKAQGWK